MKLPFLNRFDELSEVKKLLSERSKSSANFIHLETSPATGLTSFLKFSSSKFKSDYYSFYVDGSYNMANSLSSQILVELFNSYPELIDRFKAYFIKKYPNDLHGVGSSFFNLIPHFGPFFKDYIKESMNHRDIPQVQTTAYPSIIAELLCPFLNTISNHKPILIFVDNAQSLDSWSLDILQSSISEESARMSYIMGFVNRGNKEIEENLLWKVKSLGLSVKSLNFSIPGTAMIKEFYSYKGVTVSDSEAKELAKISNRNIYKILTYINNNEAFKQPDESLTPLQVEIIGYLSVADQPIRKSDIITLVTNSSTTYVENLSEIDDNIKILLGKGYTSISELPDSDLIVHLLPSSSPYITELVRSPAFRLVKARDLYNYFSIAAGEETKYAQTELALLLYRLSKIVDKQNVAKRIKTILSLSLKMGSTESAKRYIHKAILSAATYSLHDYLIKIAFHISIREYGESLKLLINPVKKEWSEIRIFKILLAVSYNRCRCHKESEALILELIKTSKFKAELSILLAYSIVGHLHDNNVSKAREIFRFYDSKVKGAENYGYFLRNGSTVFDEKKTEELLVQALEVFANTDDSFGYYSTLCNLGKTKCKLGKLKEAEKDLETAYEKLKVFGFHHLHVVLNNLGICKMLSGKLQEAEVFLNRALLFASTLMPGLYNKINLALLKVCLSKSDEALQIFREIEPDVEKMTFDRVRQKFYLNYVIVSFAANSDPKTILDITSKSEMYPDRMSKELTLRKLKLIKDHLSDGNICTDSLFFELADFCYLEYWYQNPLELLPVNLLPS